MLLRILIVGDSGVGKSGKWYTSELQSDASREFLKVACYKGSLCGLWHRLSLTCFVSDFPALAVRYLTKRYLGEYLSNTGKSSFKQYFYGY